MSRRTIIGLGALAIAASGHLGSVFPGHPAHAAPPRGPGPSASPGPPGAATESRPPKPPPPAEPTPGDAGFLPYQATTDEAIQLFEARVERVPHDFIGHRYLGEIWLRKAKESGDPADYAKAEAALRKALEIFPNYPRAEAALAAVLCSRHRFAEGLELARKVNAAEPGSIDALATMADALLELGRYAEAETALQDLHRRFALPEVLARLANLAELKGDAAEATRLMRQAEEAVRKVTSDPKAVAWYRARLGDIAFTAGRIEEAATHYQAVPSGTDAYHDATAGLGRVRAAQGRHDEAIALYKKAVGIGPDPHMLAALGDLYLKTGQPELARPLFDALERTARELAEYRRELANFYADHDRDLPRALELARRDLAERQDIYGYDALAWALYKNDRPEEAARAIAEALKLGTKDAKLFYHAGMIHHRLGDPEKARDYLGRALALNPHFAPLQAEEARQTLAALDGDTVPP